MATLDELKQMSPEARRQAIKSMSTEDLMRLRQVAAPQKQEQPKSPQDIIKSLPTEQLVKLQAMPPEEQKAALMQGREQSFGDKAIDAVVAVGRAIDRFTGAPARAGVEAMIPSMPREEVAKPSQLPRSRFLATDVTKPPEFGGGSVSEGAEAFVKQFGQEPELAPTGKDIATQLGASTEESLPGGISPAGVAGLAIDIIADPLNVLPVTTIGRLAGKGAKLGVKGGIEASKLALKGSAKAVGLGSTVEGVGQTAKGAKAAMSKLFNPKVAEDFSELKAIAIENDIPLDVLPEAVEFGETSIINRAARVRREGLLGEESFQRFEDGLNKVRDAVDTKLERIGQGTVLKRAEAGEFLRDAFDRGAEKIFDAADVTYNQIIKDYPGLKIAPDAMKDLDSKLDAIERFAKRRTKRGFSSGQKSQAKQLLDGIEAIRTSDGSFAEAVESLRDIGEIAFTNKNALLVDPPDIRRLRLLYDDLRDSLLDTIRTDVKDGESIAGALQINNSLLSEFFGNKSVVSNVLGNPNLGAERVFDALVKNGDTRKIEALKSVVDADDWQKIKAAMIDSLIKRTDEEEFSFRVLRNNLQRKRETLQQILDPQELKEVTDLVRLGDRFGIAVMSTSGTGASNIFKDLYRGTQEAITNDAFIEALKRRARGVTPQAAAPTVAGGSKANRLARAIDESIRAARLGSIQQTNSERPAGFRIPGGP